MSRPDNVKLLVILFSLKNLKDKTVVGAVDLWTSPVYQTQTTVPQDFAA
jgi:hypothetical protein